MVYTYRTRRRPRMIKKACDHCGGRYTVVDRRAPIARFCSARCTSDSRSKNPPRMTPERFWSKIDRRDVAGCWLWTGRRSEGGYGEFQEQHQLRFAHRRAYELTKGFIPAGLFVRHICDNPPCCRPDHLLIGTTADNMRDKVVRGRAARGEANGRSVLTREQVIEIRATYRYGQRGYGVKMIARRFHVSQSAIEHIVRGHVWRHLSPTTNAVTDPAPSAGGKLGDEATAH